MSIIDKLLNCLRIDDGQVSSEESTPEENLPSDSSQEKFDNVVCWGCGFIIPVGANFCPNCGKPQHNNMVAKQDNTEIQQQHDTEPVQENITTDKSENKPKTKQKRTKRMSKYELERFAVECNELLKKQDRKEAERNAGE